MDALADLYLRRLRDQNLYDAPSSKVAVVDEVTRSFHEGAVSESEVRNIAGALLGATADPQRAAVFGALALLLLSRVDAATNAPRIHERLAESLQYGVAGPLDDALTRELLREGDEVLRASLRENADAAARSNDMSRALSAAGILSMLAAHGDGAAVRPLVALLEHAQTLVREAAAGALGRSGRPEARAALERILAAGSGELFEAALAGMAGADDAMEIEALLATFEAKRESRIATRIASLAPRFRKRRRS